MNSLVLFALVTMAAASPQFFTSGGQRGAGGFGGRTGGGPAAATGFGGPSTRTNYGPKVYGPGINNRFAFPPNPVFMQRALSIVNRIPNTRVLVEMNGEISITDQYGRETEVYDAFGRDLTDALEF